MTQNQAEDQLLALFDRYDQAACGTINREQYSPLMSSLENAKIPRVPFLFHRVTEPEEDAIERAIFVSRFAAAADLAGVSLEAIVAALEHGAPKAENADQIAVEVVSEPESPEGAAAESVLGDADVESVTASEPEASDMDSLTGVVTDGGLAAGFAKVFLGTHELTGELAAVKVVDLTIKTSPSCLREMVLGEVALMRQAEHEHIVTVVQYGEKQGCIWVAMEFMGGGTLQTYLRTVAPTGTELSEGFVRDIFLQLLQAVDYLHNVLEVVHRDLKPENVLLLEPCNDCSQAPHCKIADFGLSTQYDSKQVLKLHCGTPTFFAPELIQDEGYSRAVDCWSLGLMLYLMLSARLPFYGSTAEKLKARIIAGVFSFQPQDLWESRAESSRDLITRLLCVDPLVRYTAKEAMYHPWAEGKESVEGPESLTITPALTNASNSKPDSILCTYEIWR